MIKIALGLISALLLAACAYTAPQTAALPLNPTLSGVGHPAADYPGPRAY